MKSSTKKAAVMLAVIFVVSLFLITAQSNPGKVKINLTCGEGGATINNGNAGTVVPTGTCSSDILEFAGPADIDVKINAEEGTSVNVVINDGAGDQKYSIHGDKSNDGVFYNDATGDDVLDFNGKGGTNSMNVDDSNAGFGAGDDQYKGRDISNFDWNEGPGIDEIDINPKPGKKQE